MQLPGPFVVGDIALLYFILEVLRRKREIQFKVVYQVYLYAFNSSRLLGQQSAELLREVCNLITFEG